MIELFEYLIQRATAVGKENMNIEKFDAWLKVAKKGEQFIYHNGHLAVDADSDPEIKKLGKHIQYNPIDFDVNRFIKIINRKENS